MAARAAVNQGPTAQERVAGIAGQVLGSMAPIPFGGFIGRQALMAGTRMGLKSGAKASGFSPGSTEGGRPPAGARPTVGSRATLATPAPVGPIPTAQVAQQLVLADPARIAQALPPEVAAEVAKELQLRLKLFQLQVQRAQRAAGP